MTRTCLMKSFAEWYVIRGVDISNLKEIWQVGRLCESDAIMKDCVEYPNHNTLLVLTNYY
jgi:hypothetical protein